MDYAGLSDSGFVDLVEYRELEEALRLMRNRKACRSDGLKAEMFKYASVNFKQRFLKFLKLLLKMQNVAIILDSNGYLSHP